MRKSGNKIKNKAVTLPLGMKRNGYEINARAALLAIERGICNEQHTIDLWVLADLCERMNEGKEKHIDSHCTSVKKLAEAIHNKTCDGLSSLSIMASCDLLLDWLHNQDNNKMLKIAVEQIKQLTV